MAPPVISSKPDRTGSFAPVATVPLPSAVETAGLTLAFHDEFRIWINRPSENRTLQFRVTAANQASTLDALPLVAAGAAACGEGFVLTGADPDGRPLVIGADSDGRMMWRHVIEEPAPVRWPMPSGGRSPMALWQTEHGILKAAQVGAA